MKRLYVRPNFRGKGLGRELTESVVKAARQLVTSECVSIRCRARWKAIAMYRSLGFREIDAYY